MSRLTKATDDEARAIGRMVLDALADLDLGSETPANDFVHVRHHHGRIEITTASAARNGIGLDDRGRVLRLNPNGA